MKLPKGYRTVMPYLILAGVEDFIKFTKVVFNAQELNVHKNDDGSIMHAEITIGDSTIMMGESSERWNVQNSGLYINVENADATFKKALVHGARVVMEMSDQGYGRTGGIKDPFGNTWWITTPIDK